MASYVVSLARPPLGYEHVEMFRETAETIVWGLRELGHHVRGVTVGDYAEREPEVTPIVLGWTMLGANRPRPGSILYNLEQAGSPWLGSARVQVLREYRVWDWSDESAQELACRGITVEGILRVGYAAVLEHLELQPEESRAIDVLFYGSLSPRRNTVLRECEDRGLHVHHVFGVYGGERDALIEQSRVVLNMHYSEPLRGFEWVRVLPLLANGCAVVSEGPVPETVRDAVMHAPIEHLAEAAARLVREPEIRRSLGDVARSVARRLPITLSLEDLVGKADP